MALTIAACHSHSGARSPTAATTTDAEATRLTNIAPIDAIIAASLAGDRAALAGSLLYTESRCQVTPIAKGSLQCLPGQPEGTEVESFGLGLCDASGTGYGEEIRSQDAPAALYVAGADSTLYAVYRPLGPTPAGGVYGIDYVIMFADRATGVESLRYIVMEDKIVEADRLCRNEVPHQFARGDEFVVPPPLP